MTLFQILSLLLAGPVALILLGQLIIIVFRSSRGDFHIIQAFLLFICIVVILVAFLGVR